jgi:hypothetical protein
MPMSAICLISAIVPATLLSYITNFGDKPIQCSVQPIFCNLVTERAFSYLLVVNSHFLGASNGCIQYISNSGIWYASEATFLLYLVLRVVILLSRPSCDDISQCSIGTNVFAQSEVIERLSYVCVATVDGVRVALITNQLLCGAH